MNHNGGQPDESFSLQMQTRCGASVISSDSMFVPKQRPSQAVVPPLSNRTLQHPSFLPLCMASGFAQRHHKAFNGQAVHPITPAEFFYLDPTVGDRGRIPNIVSELQLFDCFHLNTPPPLMSPCAVQPTHPDPFRSGPYPTRELGSTTWRTDPVAQAVRPSRAVLELTQEEDQAVTNLLKLRHDTPPALRTEKTNVATISPITLSQDTLRQLKDQARRGDVQESRGSDRV